MQNTLPPDLQQLLDDALAGNVESLNKLFAAIRPALLLHARINLPNLLRGKVDESDLAQEALAAANENFHAFRGSTPGEFLAWVRAIQGNEVGHAIERYTAAARSVAREQPLPDAPLPGSEQTPSHHAMLNEAIKEKENRLAQLPEVMRQVIQLRSVEGLPYEEVARRLGRSEEAARQLYSRAMKLLQSAE